MSQQTTHSGDEHGKGLGFIADPDRALVELLFFRDLYDEARALFEQAKSQEICDLLNQRTAQAKK